MRGKNSAKTKYTQDYKSAITFAKNDVSTTIVAATADRLNNVCDAENYQKSTAGVNMPQGCFRISSKTVLKSGKPSDSVNYASGYSVTMSPKDAAVGWGSVDWEDDPFEGLECEGSTFEATAQPEFDVCELLDEEVATAMAGKMAVEPVLLNRAAGANDHPAIGTSPILDKIQVHFTAANKPKRTRFKTLVLDFDGDGKINDDSQWRDLYSLPADGDDTASTTGTGPDPTLLNNDVYHIHHIGVTDSDGDPMTDFGKVDFGVPFVAGGTREDRGGGGGTGANGLLDTAASTGEDVADVEDVAPDGIADNAVTSAGTTQGVTWGSAERKCDPDDHSDADADACDAEKTWDIELSFHDRVGFGCNTTHMITVTCEWDAQGTVDNNPPDGIGGGEFNNFLAVPGDGANVTDAADEGNWDVFNFLSCKADSE
jgi:hypothetical protein